MACFIQILRENANTGTLTETTINIDHITRIEPNPEADGTTIMYCAGDKEVQIRTPTNYDFMIESLQLEYIEVFRLIESEG